MQQNERGGWPAAGQAEYIAAVVGMVVEADRRAAGGGGGGSGQVSRRGLQLRFLWKIPTVAVG